MPHTLLLADDSVTIQRVIELTFADEDVHVVPVGDGRQAIDRITHEPPDIVLADVGMPGCDGYAVAEFVKDRPDLAHIPVLLLAGAFEPVDEARVRQVRADGVLAKPFEPHELITRVRALLGLASSQSLPAAARVSPVAGADPGGGAPPPADEHVAPAVAAPGVGLSPSTSGAVSLDDYFDRLDAAFASLSVPSHIDEAAALPRPVPENAWRERRGIVDAESEHLPSSLEPAPGRSGQTSLPAGALAGKLSASEAFAAFLEAEQTGPHPLAPGQSPVSAVLPPSYPPIEELTDMVVRRVIAQLTDQVVRESVADAVSEVAERLVREEIERLKAAIT